MPLQMVSEDINEYICIYIIYEYIIIIFNCQLDTEQSPSRGKSQSKNGLNQISPQPSMSVGVVE